MKGKGWHNEGYNHKLAAHGINTREKTDPEKYAPFNWRDSFAAREAINYSWRNIFVGDEEETRLLFNPTELVKQFVREGMDPKEAAEIAKLLTQININKDKDGMPLSYAEKSEIWNKISNTLYKYITAPKMALGSSEEQFLWQAIVLGDVQDDPEMVIDFMHNDWYTEYPSYELAEKRYNELMDKLKWGEYNA